MKTQDFYNWSALALAGAVVLWGAVALAYPAPAASAAGSERTSNLNLTVELNATTGAPQYVPANFSVPQGRVVVTLVDRDVPMAWSNCTCAVRGTVGGVELVNGSAVSSFDPANVAHTFTVPGLGVNVLSPGASTVTFQMELGRSGTYVWVCLAPCGAEGYAGFPMGTPGYMTGTMTVL